MYTAWAQVGPRYIKAINDKYRTSHVLVCTLGLLAAQGACKLSKETANICKYTFT